MGLFMGERPAAATEGERVADELIDSAQRYASAERAAADVSNEDTVEAFVRLVERAWEVGSTALSEIRASEHRTPGTCSNQVGVEDACEYLWEEMARRTKEQGLEPPLEVTAMNRATEDFPDVFADRILYMESSLVIPNEYLPEAVAVRPIVQLVA